MARNYVALPYEYSREMEALSDAEFGRLCRALLEYSELGRTIVLNGNERFFANRVMMQEDRFRNSYSSDDKRSEIARNAANARWKASNADACESNANACGSNAPDAKHAYTETENYTETDTITGIKERTPSGSKKESTPKTPLDIALDDFAVFRKAMKKPLTPKARELTIRELEKLAPGDEAMQIAIVNQSIQRGWQGVFPLKDDNPKPAKYRLQMPIYDDMEDLPI